MKQDEQPQRQNRRKYNNHHELTTKELKLLQLKRFIGKLDVMHIFNISESDFYAKVKSGFLVPTYFENRKLYDLHEIYQKLEAGKGKNKKKK